MLCGLAAADRVEILKPAVPPERVRGLARVVPGAAHVPPS